MAVCRSAPAVPSIRSGSTAHCAAQVGARPEPIRRRAPVEADVSPNPLRRRTSGPSLSVRTHRRPQPRTRHTRPRDAVAGRRAVRGGAPVREYRPPLRPARRVERRHLPRRLPGENFRRGGLLPRRSATPAPGSSRSRRTNSPCDVDARTRRRAGRRCAVRVQRHLTPPRPGRSLRRDGGWVAVASRALGPDAVDRKGRADPEPWTCRSEHRRQMPGSRRDRVLPPFGDILEEPVVRTVGRVMRTVRAPTAY